MIRNKPLKVVLVALDGNEARARALLEKSFSDATIETISRATIETAGLLRRITLVRAQRPDVFATSMESIDWQRGQTLLSLFATLTGAKTLVALDASGQITSESRVSAIVRAPLRLLREAWTSGAAILRSHREVARLEKAVTLARSRATQPKRSNSKQIEFVFLRATPGPGSQAGGASSHINGFINAAKKDGASVRVVSNDYIAGMDHLKISFTLIPLQAAGITRSAFDLRNNLLFTSGALRAINQSPPDFIYQRYSRFTWAGVAASLSSGRPLFLEYNGSEVWVGKYWDDAGMFTLLERVERLNLAAAARIFVVSEVERRNLLKAGVPSEKIVVNPNGVDVETFRPNVGGANARAELKIDDDELLVGFVGTFGPWHGLLTLARAITLIPQDSRLRFLLIGAGKLREETEQIVKVAGVGERVIFTGPVGHERVPALLDACDILLAPHVPLSDGSEFFGSPTKLFEYMAMGKGIVASRLGQIGDVLQHEETALLVTPGDVDELVAAILRLANSPQLRQNLGKKAREVARESYTWRHNAQRVLEAYRGLDEEKGDGVSGRRGEAGTR